MIDKDSLKQIKELGIAIDHKMAFAGKSKGNRHLFRVVRIAKFLAKQLNADIKVVEAGAWLHDTALPSGNDYDYTENKKIVLKLLNQINISREDKQLIAECVASHEGTKNPQTLEAKIVHDADVIEKLGILGIIRHTWKTTNSGQIDPRKIHSKDVEKIINHINWRQKKLQTEEARSIGGYLNLELNRKKINILIPIISTFAKEGVITEKIAKKIQPLLSVKEQTKLNDQLTLNYLLKFK